MPKTYKWKKYGTNKKLDRQVNSKDPDCRWQAAYNAYGLEILINDKNAVVRRAVAMRGYGLDKLINDKEYFVREKVETFLKDHNLTLGEWKKLYPEKCALN